MPIILVCVLGTLNVFLADDDGPALQDSIAIALTAVFVLPALATGEPTRGQSGMWMTWPIYALFVGIILTSFCLDVDSLNEIFAKNFASIYSDDLSDDGDDSSTYSVIHSDTISKTDSDTISKAVKILNFTGVGFMWCSPVILLLYIYKHWRFVQHITKGAMVAYENPTPIKGQDSRSVRRLIGAKDETFAQWEFPAAGECM